MRVHSTSEVNTHQQQNPFVSQNADSASVGRTSSDLSFAEQLKFQYQQAGASAVTGNTESRVAGLYWGFYPALKEQPKQEPTPKTRAS